VRMISERLHGKAEQMCYGAETLPMLRFHGKPNVPVIRHVVVKARLLIFNIRGNKT
jgi:hypothetical protein